MSTPAIVTTERLGAVARITMRRPEVRNAQNTALILALDDAMSAAAADDAVRVVILAGAGPSFSAGYFMVHQFMHGTKTAADALHARRKTGSMKRMLAERDRGVAPARRKAR